jgi:hypothetical protein
MGLLGAFFDRRFHTWRVWDGTNRCAPAKVARLGQSLPNRMGHSAPSGPEGAVGGPHSLRTPYGCSRFRVSSAAWSRDTSNHAGDTQVCELVLFCRGGLFNPLPTCRPTALFRIRYLEAFSRGVVNILLLAGCAHLELASLPRALARA